LPLQSDHFESLYRIASDPFIWQQHPNPLRYQRSEFQRFFASAIESQTAFLVCDTQTNQPIGCSRFYDHNADDRSVFIGYTFLDRDYWGKGYNTVLKQLMIRHAFKWVDTIYFQVGAQNIRSQKALEKIGAIRVNEPSINEQSEEPLIHIRYQIRQADDAF
jgi:RimJ/RimL family protein N-acetyltransferase